MLVSRLLIPRARGNFLLLLSSVLNLDRNANVQNLTRPLSSPPKGPVEVKGAQPIDLELFLHGTRFHLH